MENTTKPTVKEYSDKGFFLRSNPVTPSDYNEGLKRQAEAYLAYELGASDDDLWSDWASDVDLFYAGVQ